MSKRSPKSIEEKLEVVNLYLTHRQSISSLVKQFGITTTTLREWVRKFEQDGSQGLLDRRGKGLESKPNLTPEEEFQLKIKQEGRNRYLEMENGLLRSSL